MLLPRWEGRVQEAGPQISLRKVLGWPEVATVEAGLILALALGSLAQSVWVGPGPQ